jgi:carbon storage regulator
MLVLTRTADEGIQIGDNVKFTILSVSGGKVRIGFEAPAEVQILRSELYEQDTDNGDDRHHSAARLESGTE